MLKEICSYQKDMQLAFDEQLVKKLEKVKRMNEPISEVIGIENEYFVLDTGCNPVSQIIRDKIVNAMPYTKREIGASQIEFNSLPISIADGMNHMHQHMKNYEKTLSKVLAEHNCYALRMGCYPGSLNNLKVTDEYKTYQSILDEYKELRPRYMSNEIGNIDYKDIMHEMIIGCQSCQLNMEVDYNSGVELLNKLMEISPLFLAISVNSPIMDNNISQYLELRNIIWENGYDFRKIGVDIGRKSFRTGFPSEYYMNMEDYWNDIKEQTFMKYDLEHAFDNNQKMFWRIARIKLLDGKCLLEVRFMPIQPTITEDLAISLAIYSVLSEYKVKSHKLLPLSFVIENFRRASKYGPNAKVYVFDKESDIIVEKTVKSELLDMLNSILDFWYQRSPETSEIIKDVFQERLNGRVPALKEVEQFEKESSIKLMMRYII